MAGKLITAEDAAAFVSDGDDVLFTMSSPWMTPFSIGTALAKRGGKLRGVTIDTSFTLVPMLGLYGEHVVDSWTTRTLFAYNPIEPKLLTEHDARIDFVPINPSLLGVMRGRPHREEFTRRFSGSDVCYTMVTPPSEAGIVTFGYQLWNTRDQIGSARKVVAEVNPNLPVVPGGDNWLPTERIDHFVETAPRDLGGPRGAALSRELPDDEDDPGQLCAYYTAELINDGDTLMLGAGAMPWRVIEYLESKNDLGCHSEIVVPIDLVRTGQISNSRRTIATGKVSCTGLAPTTKDQLEWLDGNMRFDLRDMATNNNPRYIAENDNMVAVNAAAEISLFGEITVDRVGPRALRGVGGQMEFVIGALWSDGGRSIHAVLSTKKGADGNPASTIVPELTPPGVATIPRQLADIVVTEYGVAHLMGRTERERADALISIAHPDHRSDLREGAKRLFGVGRSIHFVG